MKTSERIAIIGTVITVLLIGILAEVSGVEPVKTEETLGTIHWGSGSVGDSQHFNFGTGSIFWSAANEHFGYFYGTSYSNPTLYFADKIEDYWSGRNSYQGVEYIWQFTNANEHEWFTEHAIIFFDETSGLYTGILLIRQGGLYGAIKPKSVHYNGGFVLEYDWWYDDSGGSDFSSLKPIPYDVTIESHCYTEGIDLSVSITMDGSPTGYNTPHTFTDLTGTHTFTVTNMDPGGHQFKQWNTGEMSTTITVTSAGTYTAYYQAKYNLTITTTTGGTTSPSPGTHIYWDGTLVYVTAIAGTCYPFDHWELDGDNVGSDNPYSVIMDDHHALHAIFTARIHDIAVTNITLSDSVVRQGDSLTVYVTVENQGHFTETFDVTAYASGDMFLDAFNSLNTDIWRYYNEYEPEESVSVSGGLLHVRGPWYFEVVGLTSITEFDYPITVETKLRSIYDYHCSPRLLFGTESNPCYIELCYDNWDNGWHVEYTDTTGTHFVNWAGSVSIGTWYKLKLVIDEANFKAYLDDTLKVERAWSPPDEYPKVISLTSKCGMIGSGDFDWVRIQSKYDTKIGESTVVDLAPGESTIVSFKWSTKGVTMGYYTVRANIYPVSCETDVSDNTNISDPVRISACGDCNADENVEISDVVSLVNYLFRDGPEPVPMVCVADANGDREVTIADAVYLINYLFKEGDAPVDDCCAI